MLELWKLRRNRNRVAKAYAKDLRKLAKNKAPQDERYALEAQEYFELREADRMIDIELSDRLFRTANRLDVNIPPVKDGTMWFTDEHTGRIWLTPNGRFTTRKLIDEEKSRRFEVTTRWIKLLLPVITAAAGLIGVITGLVAVLRK